MTQFKQQAQPLLILQGYIKKEFYNTFLEEWLISMRNRIRLNKAIKLAEAKHSETLRPYYVLNGGVQGLVIFNSRERKALIKAKFLKKRLGHHELMSVCLYYTGLPRKDRVALAEKEAERLTVYFQRKKDLRMPKKA